MHFWQKGALIMLETTLLMRVVKHGVALLVRSLGNKLGYLDNE
jgi:hypothetical protein